MLYHPLYFLWRQGYCHMKPLPVPDTTVASGSATVFDKAVMVIVEDDPVALEALLRSEEGNAALTPEMRTSLACLAAYRGQDACLEVFGKYELRIIGAISLHAADAGHLSSLRLAHQLGDLLNARIALQAAVQGHADCLAFILEHGQFGYGAAGYETNAMLYVAITQGDLACLKVLIDLRRPSQACLYAPMSCFMGSSHGAVIDYERPMGPNQFRCLQHLFDKGWPIHPGTLIMAARFGNVECVRFLHSRGVPIWRFAFHERAEDRHAFRPPCICDLYDRAEGGCLMVPALPELAKHMRKALMYGAAHGARVTPAMQEMFAEQRRATRTILLSFQVATQLSQGEGTAEQWAAWAVMGRVPIDIIEKILLLSDFEIIEALRRRKHDLPAQNRL